MQQEDDTPPELAGYQPGEVGALRGPRMRRIARVVVVLAVAGLVLPGILIGIGTATRTAALGCEVTTARLAPDAESFEARFDLDGARGPGWYCYATDFGGHETQLSFLGFIPEVRVVPAGGTNV
ncbi:hypothetical protein [Protaetiibacter intestinalis]|uniref:Uncharacterized protein n=1 Tax=Protaetiibacter intestinalis TaxID=2419774 RepID=A0A387B7Q7_9MICO|nr:hypothetical protein [Protaetiibacter intestinalis]AYF98387.1 hypothetical protein D7I47_09035 [Protaetiibacter intestinalis]